MNRAWCGVFGTVPLLRGGGEMIDVSCSNQENPGDNLALRQSIK